jgi:oligogalacturonide transporter
MTPPAGGTAIRKPRFINYAAYGSNDFLGAGAMAVISGWILFFYTTFCGLSAVQAASIFAVARIVDAVASPIIGFTSDRFGRTWLGKRFGRRKFFILASIPLMPSFALMWVAGQPYLYYLVTYVVFEFIYTFELIPYETLAAEMSPDYRVKAKFAGARILCGQVAAILAGFLPGRLVEALGKESADTFLYLGVIFTCVFMVAAGLVYAFTWERKATAHETAAAAAPRGSLWSGLKTLYGDLASTLKVRAFRLHLGMYLGGYTSQDIFNAVFTYFVVFAIGGTLVTASNLMGAMAACQLVAVAITIPLILRLHPAPTYRVAVGFYALGVVGLLAIYAAAPQGAGWWLFLPIMAAGLGRGALNYIPWNTYNYMADVDEIVTGRRREGAYAGMMTFIRKAAQAGAVMMVGWILQQGGFTSGATVQSPSAVTTIVLILALGTLGVLALGVLVSFRFKLDGRTHPILMETIERLRRGAGHETPPEHRRVVEDLSGWPYEKLWGAATKTTSKVRGP